MDHGQLTMIADKFQWVFSESFASQSVETSADVHCAFNAFWGTTMTSKALYTQLAKPHCADVARTMAARPSSDMTLQVLGEKKGTR